MFVFSSFKNRPRPPRPSIPHQVLIAFLSRPTRPYYVFTTFSVFLGRSARVVRTWPGVTGVLRAVTILKQHSPSPMMLQIKFGCERPTGCGEIHVLKCGCTHRWTMARIPSYRLRLWAINKYVTTAADQLCGNRMADDQRPCFSLLW